MFFRLTSKISAEPFVLLVLLWTTAVCAPSAAWAANDGEDAQAIVERADRVRFPKDDFQVDVRITVQGSTVVPPRHHRVMSKGLNDAIVTTIAPADERGLSVLSKGRDLWVFMPSVSQPIRLPLSQRLVGQVAYGDIARANFAGDYQATLLRTESSGSSALFVLELNAVDKAVPYSRVVYWVEKGTYRPHKAEFYTLSGRMLKTCLYENFAPMEGQLRPTRLVMIDALKADERSVLEYSDMQVRELPEKYFTKDYLKKLVP